MNELQKTLANTVNGFLGTQVTTEAVLIENMMKIAQAIAPSLVESELQEVIDHLSKTRIIVIPGFDGELVTKTHTKWLPDRKNSIDWVRWEAYKQLLASKQISPFVIESMDARNEKLLDLAGDPMQEGVWGRNGLVIGDVQSGKTANYIALFNKAADAGYKVFILLAGGTNKLRQQTQSRIDEGFVGIDTRTVGTGIGTRGLAVSKKIGIGLISPHIATNSKTNFFNDFSSTAAGEVVHLAGDSTPTVFVIKKNKTVLRNLKNWLTTSAGQDLKIKVPMLLLDDEADYASINTSASTDYDEATAINKGIRDLLNVFEKSSYIGFTATPFANVLIDDEAQGDLFPKDFIITLESPSNYFGPRKMKVDENGINPFTISIEDAEGNIPIKHVSSFQVNALPDSLVDSINAFFLTNAIRDLRPGQTEAARSMMINVSRFVKVQTAVHSLVQERVSMMKDSLQYERPNSSEFWNSLERTFRNRFGGGPESWEQVKDVIAGSSSNIAVHLVNSSKNNDDWDKVYSEARPRVIAVGGDVLSRGLTLEGLSTSYFYRKSLAYDTLMQMGRWFGYRDGYEDLCRLWIDNDVSTWYQDIADAMDELREDLDEMAKRGLEPSQFGLAIRCHPAAMLTVTARNKMRAGRLQEKEISVSEIDTETARLLPDSAYIEKNWASTLELVSKLRGHGCAPSQSKLNGRVIYRDVNQSFVGDFLSDFIPAPIELLFGGAADGTGGAIATFVKSNTSPSIQNWDVVIMAGESRRVDTSLHEQGLALVSRQVKIKPGGGLLYVGGKKQRLGGVSDLGSTLTTEQLTKIKDKAKLAKRVPSSYDFRRELKNPLLLIYPVEAQKPVGGVDTPQDWKAYTTEPEATPLIGIHVAFPKRTDDYQTGPKIKYIVGTVFQRLEEQSVKPVEGDETEQLDSEA